MRIIKTLVCAACLTAGFGVSGLAVAADNCSGDWVNVGATYVRFDKSRGPSDSRHVSVGGCDGERCTVKDKGGDEYTFETAYAPGDEAATWKITGGTGKYANAGWSGWYKQTKAAGDVRVGIWGGNCKMTVARAREVRLTKDEMRSIFTNTFGKGMCTDGANFENVYGSDGSVDHITRSSAGQLLFSDQAARWSFQDADDGPLFCQTWSSGGVSCWKNSRDGTRYVGREQGGQDRTCWFTVAPR